MGAYIMLRKYEYMFILNPAEEGVVKQTKDEIKSYIQQFNGTVLREEDYGIRRLAYHVNKRDRGYYYLMHTELEGDALLPIDREIKLNEDILKYICVKLSKKPTPLPEKLGDEIQAKFEDSEEDEKKQRQKAEKRSKSLKSEDKKITYKKAGEIKTESREETDEINISDKIADDEISVESDVSEKNE